MRYAIQCDPGHVVYDGPNGRPLTFDTRRAARRYMIDRNWHYVGMRVVESAGLSKTSATIDGPRASRSKEIRAMASFLEGDRPSDAQDTRGSDECHRLAKMLQTALGFSEFDLEVNVMPRLVDAYAKGTEIGAEYAKRSTDYPTAAEERKAIVDWLRDRTSTLDIERAYFSAARRIEEGQHHRDPDTTQKRSPAASLVDAVRWMRETYPMNKHARQWADELDREFLSTDSAQDSK